MTPEFTYDKLTGSFTKDGSPYSTSSSAKGYSTVYFNGRNVYAHRLAFYLTEGQWPEADVDHVNGNRKDNRWENLRKATRSQNLMNKSGHRELPKNVYWAEHCGKYRVKLKVRRETIHGGYWDDVEDAEVAAHLLRVYHHGEYSKA